MVCRIINNCLTALHLLWLRKITDDGADEMINKYRRKSDTFFGFIIALYNHYVCELFTILLWRVLWVKSQVLLPKNVFFCFYHSKSHDYVRVIQFSQFSHSVVSDSLRPHGLPHARLPCPSPTPRAYSDSCPSSRWCHPTISSSVVPFSSCLQSFPASGSFQMSQFFASVGQSIGVSSVLPMNIQDWFPLELTS